MLGMGVRMEEDIKLVSRFKNKDMAAYDEIFSKYYKPVSYYIFKMVYNKEIAEDITQDTFIKVYKALGNVDDNVRLSSWIYRIAHNACIDYIRKNKSTLELLDNAKEICDLNRGPEQQFMNKELHDKIVRVMGKINSRYRSVLILRDYNDLSYKDISIVLKCSESAIKSLIHRARLEFQKVFEAVD